MRKTLKTLLAVAGITAMTGTGALAQEVTLRLHHFLSPTAAMPNQVLDVWAENIERDSDGRIGIERFGAMSLGGGPGELMDQVADGFVDIVWSVNGFTPGRFPRTEVFELPFFVTDPLAATYAYWHMYQEHMRDTEFDEVVVLGTWVHGPGMFHSNRPITQPADMRGMKMRFPSRMVGQLLETLGAEAIGMPAPAVPEAMSRGVIDGTAFPWEVTAGLRIAELVDNHTEFEGAMLYTVTFTLSMNRDRYESLPEDLREIIDRHSGLDFSLFVAEAQLAADDPARAIAVERGNNIITVSEEDAAAWGEAAAPVYERWVSSVAGQGIDGQALIDQARALMEEFASR